MFLLVVNVVLIRGGSGTSQIGGPARGTGGPQYAAELRVLLVYFAAELRILLVI